MILDVHELNSYLKAMLPQSTIKQYSDFYHCVKSVQIGSFFGPYFPEFGPNTGKYGPEITPYFDTFHAPDGSIDHNSVLVNNSLLRKRALTHCLGQV